jgi:uncharacterized membrane protein
MKRYFSVDVLRAVAILLMIQVHFAENLSADTGSWPRLYAFSTLLGRWPAPLFTLLSGLSVSLWLRKQRDLGRSEEQIDKYLIRRGLFLFGLGMAFAFFVWFPEQTFNWDILPLLGAATLILAAARRAPPAVLAGICLLVLLASPPLRQLSQYASYWDGNEYVYDFTLKQVLLGFFLNGYFPLLPWIVFPVAGYVLGETVLDERRQGAWLRWRLPALGGGLMALGGFGLAVHPTAPRWMANCYATGLSFYPASTTYILGILGFSMLCWWLLYWGLDRNPRITGDGPVLTFFRRYSTFALTAYIVHHMAHLWPLWLYAVWRGKLKPTYYEGEAMDTLTALLLAAAFIAVFYAVLALLDRHRKYSLESWMRWVCE